MSATTAIKVGLVLAMVGLVVLLGVGLAAYEQVPEGNEGVKKTWGAVNGQTLHPGAHLVVPIMDDVQNVEVRPRTYTMSQTIGEGDRNDADAITVKTINGSTVAVDITVRYRIEQEAADTFVEEWNNEEQMEERLIRPTIRSELRDEASRLQTTGDSAIYTQGGRQSLQETANQALEEEFSDQPIVLEAVQIRNIDLPSEIDRTLDEKEQAKQQVEVERERVKQEEARAEQKRVQAQAEADVINIRGQALRENSIVLQSRLIDAYDEGTVYLTNASGAQPLINAEPQEGSTSSDSDILGNTTATP